MAERMKMTFLGTGTSIGVPVIGCKCDVCRSTDARDKRLRTSALWEVGDKRILIDAGPDFRYQMLRAGSPSIDAILLTHLHYDHVGGLDDVRGINYITHRAIDIYADERTCQMVRHNMPYVFVENKYPGVPDMSLHTIDDKPFCVSGIDITPIPVMHYKLPILGYRINNWAYITDANYISPESLDKIRDCEVLIINALRIKEHISHFNLEQSLDIIRQVKPQRAYLTHFSHEIGLHRMVQPTLPDNVFMAYDGLIIE